MSECGFTVDGLRIERATVTVQVEGRAPRVYTFLCEAIDPSKGDLTARCANAIWENRLSRCLGAVLGACDALVDDMARQAIANEREKLTGDAPRAARSGSAPRPPRKSKARAASKKSKTNNSANHAASMTEKEELR